MLNTQKKLQSAASKKFHIDRKIISEWRKQRVSIHEKIDVKTKGHHSKRLDGGGRKLSNEGLEEHVMEWISNQRSKYLRVSRKQIMRKAKRYAELKAEEEARLNDLRVSEVWLNKFMTHNGLSLRRCTTQAQKTPEKIIEKLISYILYVLRFEEKNKYNLSQIIAMDETAVWHDMISNTTVTEKGAKSVVLKTTGHEKNE